MKRLSILLMLTATALPAETFREWLYRKLGIDPKALQRQVATLASGDRRHGTVVMAARLKEKDERPLWRCDDCWSPALDTAGPVVAKADGIYSATSGKRLVALADILEILGRAGTSTNLLVLVKAPAGSRCASTLYAVTTADGQVRKESETLPACPDAEALLIHRDQIRGNQLLTNTSREGRSGDPLMLQVLESGKEAPVPFLPELSQKLRMLDRFDPIWWNSNEIVFLADR